MKTPQHLPGIACLFFAAGAFSATADVENSIWERERLGGDLFGARNTLAAHGMDFRVESMNL